MNILYNRFYASPEPFSRALGFAYDALVKGPYKFDAYETWTKLSERISQGVYMGDGLLLPHTRIPGLPGPLMTFAVCPKGFTGVTIPGGEIPQFLCLLLSPAESALVHTQTIAEVAKLLLNKEWKARALACSDDAQVAALF